VQTHVLSAVYVVAADYDSDGSRPWLMETDPSFTGEQDKVVCRVPDEILLYIYRPIYA
jgi:hypothetical protein